MEPCRTLIIVCNHELKIESSFTLVSFGVDLKGNFLLVLDYHDLHHIPNLIWGCPGIPAFYPTHDLSDLIHT